VRDLLKSAGVENARTLRGIFPDQTAGAVDGPIALLHVDVDVYQSAMDVVNWALPRIPMGGVVVFDDYGFFGCEGVARAVHELRERMPGFFFFHNLNGHAVFVRLSTQGAAAPNPAPVEAHLSL
jgi:O-methyltransferase